MFRQVHGYAVAPSFCLHLCSWFGIRASLWKPQSRCADWLKTVTVLKASWPFQNPLVVHSKQLYNQRRMPVTQTVFYVPPVGRKGNWWWTEVWTATDEQSKRKKATPVLKVLTLMRLCKRKFGGFWELIREQTAMVHVPQRSAFARRGNLSMQRQQKHMTREAGGSQQVVICLPGQRSPQKTAHSVLVSVMNHPFQEKRTILKHISYTFFLLLYSLCVSYNKKIEGNFGKLMSILLHDIILWKFFKQICKVEATNIGNILLCSWLADTQAACYIMCACLVFRVCAESSENWWRSGSRCWWWTCAHRTHKD